MFGIHLKFKDDNLTEETFYGTNFNGLKSSFNLVWYDYEEWKQKCHHVVIHKAQRTSICFEAFGEEPFSMSFLLQFLRRIVSESALQRKRRKLLQREETLTLHREREREK